MRNSIKHMEVFKGMRSVWTHHFEPNHKALARGHSHKICNGVSGSKSHKQQVGSNWELNLESE
jgi:hypothetical protein